MSSELILDSLRRRMRAMHSLYHDAVDTMTLEHVNHVERDGVLPIAFCLFHIEGVRALGFRGYFGKFFNFSGFKEGPAAGIIALFVGVLEFLLEFVKPVTLSMRLFGNIYAGEIALGVISALTFVIIPVAMLSLEFLLNFMQALIFSVLTLMFTLIAIEGHHEEEHAGADEGIAEHLPEGNIAPKAAGA